MLDRLKSNIESAIKVIIVECNDGVLVQMLSDAIKEKGIDDIEVWHSTDVVLLDEKVISIRPDQMHKILSLYYLYDFSDRVMVVSDTFQYGSMFNYVKSGIMTPKEMIEALLYRC